MLETFMNALIFCDSFMDSDVLNRRDKNLACLPFLFFKTKILKSYHVILNVDKPLDN